jgi:capsid portal protein
MTANAEKKPNERMEMFTFGDPEPVLDQREMLGYSQSTWNGRWYEPPVDQAGLAKSM